MSPILPVARRSRDDDDDDTVPRHRAIEPSVPAAAVSFVKRFNCDARRLYSASGRLYSACGCLYSGEISLYCETSPSRRTKRRQYFANFLISFLHPFYVDARRVG